MKKWVRRGLFITAGGILGYAYYRFFGCTNGCAISSNPWISTVYVAIIGGLLSEIVAPKAKD